MSVEIQGLTELIEQFEELKDTEQFKQAIGTACALVERAAKQKAPKENTGELRRSITSKVLEDGGSIIGEVFTPLEYAPYVEYGTGLFAEDGKGRSEVPWVYVEGNTNKSNKKTVYDSLDEAQRAAAYLRKKGLEAYVTYGQKPQPFLRPALNENREKILRILKGGIDEE